MLKIQKSVLNVTNPHSSLLPNIITESFIFNHTATWGQNISRKPWQTHFAHSFALKGLFISERSWMLWVSSCQFRMEFYLVQNLNCITNLSKLIIYSFKNFLSSFHMFHTWLWCTVWWYLEIRTMNKYFKEFHRDFSPQVHFLLILTMYLCTYPLYVNV